jgi:large subunit ribosomal protein L23
MAIPFFKRSPSRAKPQNRVSIDPARPAMRRAEPISLIPHLSEKTQRLKDTGNAYVFRIPPRVTKVQVAHEIHTSYRVTVKGVRIINIPRKLKRMGSHTGYGSAIRKAIVTLSSGDKIDLA